jgi:hypothetical protein
VLAAALKIVAKILGNDWTDAKAAEVFAVLILFNELPDRLHVVLGLTLWFEIQRQVIAGTVGEFIVVVIVQSCRYYLRWKNINLWFRLCA